MYKCLENVPKETRQAAFDFLVNHGYFGVRRGVPVWMAVPAALFGAYYYCPLGAVNHVLGLPNVIRLPYDLKEEHDEAWFYDVDPDDPEETHLTTPMPEEAFEAEFALKIRGIASDRRSLRAFMESNDRGRFKTPEQLASAMGVEYRPEGR